MQAEPESEIVCCEDAEDSILVKEGIRRLKEVKDLWRAKVAETLVVHSAVKSPISPELSLVSAGLIIELTQALCHLHAHHIL